MLGNPIVCQNCQSRRQQNDTGDHHANDCLQQNEEKLFQRCVEILREAPHDEVQHQRDAQHIQHRVDLLCIARQHLDQHVRQHAQADCCGDVTGEGAEQDHYKGTEAALEVGEVQLRKARQHGEAHEDQRHAGHGSGDHQKQRGQENAHQEQHSADNRRQARATASFHADGGFNEGGDGGASGARTHHRTNGIHQKRLFNLGEVAILIQHIGLGAHGNQRAEGSKG